MPVARHTQQLGLCDLRPVLYRDGHTSLHQAIQAYEAEMITNGFEAKLASRKPIDGRDPIHNPVVGRLVLVGMRVVSALSPLKCRIVDLRQRCRGADCT